MSVKIEVNLSNKTAYSILAVLVVILATVGVYAAVSGNVDSTKGFHYADTVYVKVNKTNGAGEVYVNLQDVMKDVLTKPSENNTAPVKLDICKWQISDKKEGKYFARIKEPTRIRDGLKPTGICVCGAGSTAEEILGNLKNDDAKTATVWSLRTWGKNGIACWDLVGHKTCGTDYFAYLAC